METRNPTTLGFLGIALCGLAAAAPLAAQGFQGVVTWEMAEGKSVMTQMYKGNQVRMEMNQGGHEGVMLMDNTMSSVTMLMPQQKMYMTMDMKNMMGAAAPDDRTPPKLTDTGKSETIAGHTCEVYRYAEAAGQPETMEMCAAKGMGFFIMGQSPMGGGGGPLETWRRSAGTRSTPSSTRTDSFPCALPGSRAVQPR